MFVVNDESVKVCILIMISVTLIWRDADSVSDTLECNIVRIPALTSDRDIMSNKICLYQCHSVSNNHMLQTKQNRAEEKSSRVQIHPCHCKNGSCFMLLLSFMESPHYFTNCEQNNAHFLLNNLILEYYDGA